MTAAVTAAALLEQALGHGERFRDGQLEAILALVEQRARVLVVQRTGWGAERGLSHRNADPARSGARAGAGPQASLQLPAIAIVGSGDVDDGGLLFAASLGRRCADQGFAAVSGAARGVDLAAMTGALSREGPAIGVTVDPLAEIDDPFVVVWPILARHLREPRGERDVADATGLELTQARAWLKRAVDEGHVEVKPRPKRYVLRGIAEQLRIDADRGDEPPTASRDT